jgi:chorismate dehydratase
MPLVDGLPKNVAVSFDLPARLPKLLESGRSDAVLVSSVYALTLDGARAADGVGIVSEGPVESVRLFFKKPLDRLKSLAFDPASMTSNLLALLILRDVHGSDPSPVAVAGGVEATLAKADAAVLIGDAGMTARPKCADALDLGWSWTEWTGLPFVWALWTGLDGLDSRLADVLASSPRILGAGRGGSMDDGYIGSVAARSGWAPATVRSYLGTTMVYRVGDREKEALAEFARKLEGHGLAQGTALPEWVGAGPVPSFAPPGRKASAPLFGRPVSESNW